MKSVVLLLFVLCVRNIVHMRNIEYPGKQANDQTKCVIEKFYADSVVLISRASVQNQDIK